MYCVCVTVVQYKVTVFTGKKLFAGSDANVNIMLFGSKGQTGELGLSRNSPIKGDDKDLFENGSLVSLINC